MKITRQGQLVWQLGGKDPKDPKKFFSVLGGSWMVNHGHQLLPNGRFLFFTNGTLVAPVSEVREYQLDTAAMTATPVWSYRPSNLASPVLGDAQRLANGNTLVTISRTGVIHEVDPAGKLVMTLQVTSSVTRSSARRSTVRRRAEAGGRRAGPAVGEQSEGPEGKTHAERTLCTLSDARLPFGATRMTMSMKIDVTRRCDRCAVLE